MQEDAGNLSRFNEEEKADLRDVRACRDVHPVFFLLAVEGVIRRPVVQAGIDFAEIPGIFQFHRHEVNGGMRRDVTDVGADVFGEVVEFFGAEEFDAIHAEVLTLVESDVWPPFLPAALTLAAVEDGAEKADDDDAAFFAHGCAMVVGTAGL